MSAIFGETKIFGKLAWLLCRDTQQVKNFVEFAPYSTVFKIEAFLCSAKTLKIQNGQHFWGDKNFCQDHCCGVYLPPSIKGEEIAFPRYS